MLNNSGELPNDTRDPSIENKLPIPYIVIDGPSGTGKSTTRRCLQEILPFLVTEESDINADLEKEFCPKIKGEDDNTKRGKLFTNYRSQLFSQLRQSETIHDVNGLLCARGESTTLAYQGEEDVEKMREIWNEHRLSNVPVPDAVILLQTSVAHIDNRLQTRTEPKNRFSGQFTTDENKGRIARSYQLVSEFLQEKGVAVLSIDTGDPENKPLKVVNKIIEFLIEKEIIVDPNVVESIETNNILYQEREKFFLQREVFKKAVEYWKKGRGDFDKWHTIYGINALEQIKDKMPEEIYNILWFSFCLHDIGYGTIADADYHNYEGVLKQKDDHMIEGAKEAREVLTESDLLGVISKEQLFVINHLILKHDKVEEIVNYKYKGFNIGELLMNLDTLGAYTTIFYKIYPGNMKGASNFTPKECFKYVAKNNRRRLQNKHPLLEERLSMLQERVNSVVEFFGKKDFKDLSDSEKSAYLIFEDLIKNACI